MEPNYYEILGVPESASRDAVQEAYRRLAKVYHPDRSGDDTAARFRAVQEAWEVLGNPEQRRAYDVRRRQVRRRPPFVGPAASRFPFGPWPAGREEALHLQLRMSPAEAFTGGDVVLDLPAWQPCRPCGGRGQLGRLFCPACRGRGRTPGQERFTLHVPPQLADGQVVELRLDDLPHLLHRRLVILVRVG